MAANRFATMLHRNTNKITLILIYAGLEWTLIILLLLNSLFSYLIIKFADYFGLKPPCPWCSRVDHFFEPGKNKNSHRDLLCEVHAAEISKLGYCSNHQKIAVHQDMCEDCSSSRPDFGGVSKNFTLFPLVKQIGMIGSDGDKAIENGEMGLKCSCCGVSLENKIYSPYIVINPSWDVLEYTQKGNLITEVENDDQIEEGDNSDRNRTESVTDHFEDDHGFEIKSENQILSDVNGAFEVKERNTEDCFVSLSKFGFKELEGDEDDKEGVALEVEKESIKDDNSNMIVEDPISDETMVEILPQHLEFFIDCSGHRLVPVELLDSPTGESQSRYRVEEDQENTHHQDAKLGSEVEPKFAVFESMEMEETENSLVFHAKECDSVYEQVAMTQTTHTPSQEFDDVQEIATAEREERDSDVPPVSEEVSQMPINETEAEVSIGTDIPDLDLTDDIQAEENLSSYTCLQEDPSTSSVNLHRNDDYGSKEVQEEALELKTLSVELNNHAINNQLSQCSEYNEMEEEKFPDTPTSIESFLHLHKKLLLLERKESGAEESLDGSVISDFEGSDGVLTVERLTSALRAERKALHALYSELEEERSASAVAASQTMAMINRLQEEKAAVQMEALQYQRMMEEQSEYDQEALQLLNELMVKREKEKQELEKELEIYRKRVLEFEAKEKMRMLRRSKDGSARSGFSSASCSNAEDSDGLSIDLNQEAKEEDSINGRQESTPVDAVINLGESLTEFEEERLSILEQLKVLEEKLFTLSDEEEQHFEDIRPIEDFHKENGKHLNGNSNCNGEEVNGMTNGFQHQERRIMGPKAKRLLPLFDAISSENEDGEFNEHENGFHSYRFINSTITRFELENKRVAIEEEVDQVYERLQALEADREFLKHCMGSLKKGDKGMDLLQEILHHLRDLRNVELRVKNLSDCALV